MVKILNKNIHKSQKNSKKKKSEKIFKWKNFKKPENVFEIKFKKSKNFKKEKKILLKGKTI